MINADHRVEWKYAYKYTLHSSIETISIFVGENRTKDMNEIWR